MTNLQAQKTPVDANEVLQTQIEIARTRSNAVIPHGKRPAKTNVVKRNSDDTLKNKYAGTMNYK